MKIRQLIFNFFAKGRKKGGNFIPWKDIRNVLLLFESDIQEKNIEIKKIIQRLQQEGKSVISCGYVDKKRSEFEKTSDMIILDRSAYTFFRSLKSSAVANIKNKKFDVVIDLSSEAKLELKYVLLQVDAIMRCGRQTQRNFYDFMIDIPLNNIEETSQKEAFELYAQLERYMKMMSGK